MEVLAGRESGSRASSATSAARRPAFANGKRPGPESLAWREPSKVRHLHKHRYPSIAIHNVMSLRCLARQHCPLRFAS